MWKSRRPEKKGQFNVYLSADLVRSIKHRSIDEQVSLSAFVEKVMREYCSRSSYERCGVG